MKKIYCRLSRILPAQLRFLLSKAIFWSLRKPRYYVAKQHDVKFNRGILCISADFELAWAWRYAYNPKVDLQKISLQERANVPLILKKLEELNISITWAIVGHLFLEDCKRDGGIAHPDMPRPKFFKNELWEFSSGDWYDLDPCSDYQSAPSWYAPDLIKQIMNSQVPHEIACHSFSHIGFNENYCSKELAEAEIRKCAQIMEKFELKPISMVFPGDEAGHLDLLAKYGFKAIRYFGYNWVEISKPIKLKVGLWAINSSSNIVPDENWDSKYILWRLKKYVAKAIEKKALCHFWFHPSLATQRITEVLFPLLNYCVKKRREGKLDIMTMQELSELMEWKAKALQNSISQTFV